MREFEVAVIRTDVYTVRIDEDKMHQELINVYERGIHKLGDDKVKSLAKDIGFGVDNNGGAGFIEGIGYIEVDGLTLGEICETGIEVETISIEDYDVEIKEIN
jgi:hypothetical protein